MDDMADVIALLASGTYTVTRPGPTGLASGRRVAGVTTSFSIVASVQPASGRQMDRLPEGLREREGMTLWTTTDLRTAQVASGIEADLVSIDGSTFEVVAIDRWASLGNYYRATVTRVPA